MTLPVMTLLLTTALPMMKTPPPDMRPLRVSPVPPVIVQLSMEKSVRTRPLVRPANMTAA